jgi:hypothetical protein
MATPETEPTADAAASGFKAMDEAAQAVQSAAETAEEATTHTATRLADAAEAAVDRTGEFTRSWVETSASTASALSEAAGDLSAAPHALSRGAGDLAVRARSFAGEWLQLIRERAAKNVEVLGRLTECRSPSDLIKLQSELAGEVMQDAAGIPRRELACANDRAA